MSVLQGEELWELAQKGVLCDLVLIEQPKTGQPKEHTVHKLVMFAQCPFFRSLFSLTSMKDSDTNKIIINTEADEANLLEFVIRTMYNMDCLSNECRTFVKEHDMTTIMHLYILCSYLQLSMHTYLIERFITEHVDISDITLWWRAREDQELLVPKCIENIVQKYLASSLLYNGAEKTAFISVKALKCLWPTMSNDPISNAVHIFLDNLYEASAVQSDSSDSCE